MSTLEGMAGQTFSNVDQIQAGVSQVNQVCLPYSASHRLTDGQSLGLEPASPGTVAFIPSQNYAPPQQRQQFAQQPYQQQYQGQGQPEAQFANAGSTRLSVPLPLNSMRVGMEWSEEGVMRCSAGVKRNSFLIPESQANCYSYDELIRTRSKVALQWLATQQASVNVRYVCWTAATAVAGPVAAVGDAPHHGLHSEVRRSHDDHGGFQPALWRQPIRGRPAVWRSAFHCATSFTCGSSNGLTGPSQDNSEA